MSGAYPWLAGEGRLTSGARLLTGEGRLESRGASGWLVKGVVRLGRILLAGDGRLASGAHLIG